LEVIDYQNFTGRLQDGYDLFLEKISEHCINLKELSTTMSSIHPKDFSSLNHLFKKCTQLKSLKLFDENRNVININNILPLLAVSPISELKNI
jgi:hypothetical protein